MEIPLYSVLMFRLGGSDTKYGHTIGHLYVYTPARQPNKVNKYK
jgi:hypothetical protein